MIVHDEMRTVWDDESLFPSGESQFFVVLNFAEQSGQMNHHSGPH